MALPMNTAPVYNLEIPSTKQKIKYKPFLVGEQKTLLIAQQSEDLETMVESLKTVIKSCILDDIDVNALALFDLEYIFIQIRAKSVGEISELLLSCDTCTDEKAVSKVNIDLTKLQVNFPEGHTNKISLYDNVSIALKYPSLSTIVKMENTSVNDFSAMFDIIIDCIDYIYTDEDIFYAKDESKEELTQFLNNLTTTQFEKVKQFFETMPKLEQKIKYNCPVCNKEHNKTIEGMANFF